MLQANMLDSAIVIRSTVVDVKDYTANSMPNTVFNEIQQKK